jgi:hypothetical protein
LCARMCVMCMRCVVHTLDRYVEVMPVVVVDRSPSPREGAGEAATHSAHSAAITHSAAASDARRDTGDAGTHSGAAAVRTDDVTARKRRVRVVDPNDDSSTSVDTLHKLSTTLRASLPPALVPPARTRAGVCVCTYVCADKQRVTARSPLSTAAATASLPESTAPAKVIASVGSVTRASSARTLRVGERDATVRA